MPVFLGGKCVAIPMVNLHRYTLVKPDGHLQSAYTVVKFAVHQFVGYDIDALTLRADHDARSAADHLGTSVAIELKRANSHTVEENKNWL